MEDDAKIGDQINKSAKNNDAQGADKDREQDQDVDDLEDDDDMMVDEYWYINSKS